MSKGKQRRHILSHLKDRHSLDHPRGYLEKPEAALFYPHRTVVGNVTDINYGVKSDLC